MKFHSIHLVSSQKTFNFNSIILLNESIKQVDQISFQIRLKALNSLISISRLDNKESIGFSAVSFELIDFSKTIEEKTSQLREVIYAIILHSTIKTKNEKQLDILQKTQSNLPNSYQLHSILSDKESSIHLKKEKFTELFNSLIKIVLETIKFSKKAHFISICTKIETAYINNLDRIYYQLAEEVSSSLKNLLEVLNKIQKQLDF